MAEIRWYVLEDGRPGHANQSWGLVQQFDLNLKHTCSSRHPAPRSWLKRPLQALLHHFKSPILLRLTYLIYYRSPLPPHSPANVILSTGGDTLIGNIILAQLWNIPNIFIGKESSLTAKAVALVITTAEGLQKPNVLRLSLACVRRAYPEPEIAQASPLPLIAVLIGGDSQEYQYAQADYEMLADVLNCLCQNQKWQLLITTSRRTGTMGEAILKSRIDQKWVAEATWYGEQPRPTSGPYSMRADVILCSEDSGSMLTESLAYGKPIVAFYPSTRSLSAFYQRFLERIALQGVIASTIPALKSHRLHDLHPAQSVDYSSLKAAVLHLVESR